DALNKRDPDIIGAGLADAGAAAISLDGGPMMPAITAPSGSPPQVAPNTAVTFAGICGYDGIRSLDYDWFFGTSEIPNSHKRDPDPVEYAYGGVYTVQFFCSDDLQRAEADLVLDVEAPATAEDLSFSVVQNQRFTGQLKGSGLGGGSLIYEATTLPGHGTLTIHGPGPGYDYIPDKDYVGDDSFQYYIDNGVMKSNVATVSISVKAAPPPPPPPPPPPTGGGGGGSLGAAVLGLLAGLALLLRRRRWTRMRIK
ncbi:MAG TPA: Ig-like domain-containing protein, partial [Gammaproteobacteria bacterium]|nr:Ig-like domain-containing protein [Gammaproteobacteria bacterium]